LPEDSRSHHQNGVKTSIEGPRPTSLFVIFMQV
jgi:hypothetical protein